MKKVLRVKYGEYLAIINSQMLQTTFNIDEAIDLNDLSWAEISRAFSELHNHGFKKAKVIEVTK